MLDIHRLAAETDAVCKRLDDRGPGHSDLARQALAKYEKWKSFKHQAETKQAEKNAISKLTGQVAKAKSFDELAAPLKEQVEKLLGETAKKGTPLEAMKEHGKTLGESINSLNAQADALETEWKGLLLTIPNPPHPSVPLGKGAEQNEVKKSWGEIRKFDFTPLDHADLGERLGILDFARGVKIAQARFTLLRGWGAKLQWALISYMLDLHQKHGYSHVWPPFMANAESMTGTTQLPKFEMDLFKVEKRGDDEKTLRQLYLIPTAEVPVTNMYRDEILPPGSLPQSLVAYTPCFRSEAGSYGKDTKGLIRQHQFEKVELVKFTAPEDSEAEHEKLVSDAERVLEMLELPYRRMLLCTGDQGFGAAKCYDLEVWLPGQNAYREISSCSNFLDFQARRADIKFRRDAQSKPELVHTLNGSGLAVGRTLVAILENYQRADCSVEIPKVLRSYVGGAIEIPAPGR